ncbi:cilia- and flagella-associated protein 69 [Neosynchiropus ocellatus]
METVLIQVDDKCSVSKMESGIMIKKRKPQFPLLNPAPLDKTQRLQEGSSKNPDLTKLISLLEDPLTTNLKERNIFLLKRIVKTCQHGILLKEMANFGKIFFICSDKVADHPEYASLLCEVLRISSLPFLKEKSSDEPNYSQDGTQFFCHMGCLMKVPDPNIKQQLVDTVKSYYSCVAPKQLLPGTDLRTKTKPRTFNSCNCFSRLSLRLVPTSPGYILQLIERSDLAKTLLLSLHTLDNEPSIKMTLLHLLDMLSLSSDRNCALMLSAHGAETICLYMNERDPTGQILFRSSEILWNLVEKGSKDEVTAQLSNIECLTSLKEAFFHQLLSSRQYDLRLRNDLLVITTIIAAKNNSLLVESMFAKHLIAVATFPELRSQNPFVQNLTLTGSKEDFSMKKMLLNLLVLMSDDSAARKLYKEEQVFQALLTVLSGPIAQVDGVRQWNQKQQEELQLQALVTLESIAPLMLDDYMACQANSRLLALLDWCVGQDSMFGPDDSVNGEIGSTKALMRHCARVLRSVTAVGEMSVNQDLCDQGIISQLIGILMQMEVSIEEEDTVTMEIKSDIQLILSSLCEVDMHKKELFGSEGVLMAIRYLTKGSDKFYSGLGHNKLLLSTLDCLWSCVVGCYTTEDYFLAKDGVLHLLNLLMTCPKCVRGIVLAILLELCDNPNTVSHILNWTHDSGETAPRLLLQLWMEEELGLGVSRTRHGAIKNPKKPLLTEHQKGEPNLSVPASVPSAAVLEISENLRCKIYFLFCKLGFEDLPGLSTKDYITLAIVKRYLDFKVGEIWDEIREELKTEGMRPIPPDEEALDNMCFISEDTARKVIAEQRSILQLLDEEDIREEELICQEIKTYWMQYELMAESWDRYVAKASDYELLKELQAQRESTRTAIDHKHDDLVPRPPKRFMGQLLTVERTDAPGTSGLRVTLSRAPIQAAGQKEVV